MKDKVVIEIPVYYLLQIAVYGNMGTGDLPDLMKVWAQKILREKGYDEVLADTQKEHLNKLRSSLRNVLGDDNMGKIDSALSDAKTGLKFAMDLKNSKKQ